MNETKRANPYADFEAWLYHNGLYETFMDDEEDVDLEIVRLYALDCDGARATLSLFDTLEESIVPLPSVETDDAFGAGQAERFRQSQGFSVKGQKQ